MFKDKFGLSPRFDLVDCLRGFSAAACARANAEREVKEVVDKVCPDGCDDPFVITYHYGLSHARIRPSESVAYSAACLLSLGILDTGIHAGAHLVLDFGEKAAKEAGKKGLATALGAGASPPVTLAVGAITIINLFKNCECDK